MGCCSCSTQSLLLRCASGPWPYCQPRCASSMDWQASPSLGDAGEEQGAETGSSALLPLFLVLALGLLLEERAVLGGAAVAEALGVELVHEAAVVVGALDHEGQGVLALALGRAVREQVAGVRHLVQLLGRALDALLEVLGIGGLEQAAGGC